MLAKKYASPQIGAMNDQQKSMWSKALLLKIHVITGWVIPDSDLINILVDQFEKKLTEDYGNMNTDEIEYAFRQSGTTTKDWGKQMNLSLIDEVLIPYRELRSVLSMQEERQKVLPPPVKIYSDKELDDLHRGDIEAFYQRIRNGRVPYSLPEYFKPILVKDGLMKQEETLADFFQNRLGKGIENVYVKSEP